MTQYSVLLKWKSKNIFYSLLGRVIKGDIYYTSLKDNKKYYIIPE